MRYNAPMRIGDRIQEKWDRSKGVVDRLVGEWREALEGIFVPILVVLVGLSSFGLGRLSAHEDSKPSVSIRQAPVGEDRPISLGGQVVASRSGGSYHFPWCSGALTMKESNKIWFKDEEAARKAGYKPAGNCEGLK